MWHQQVPLSEDKGLPLSHDSTWSGVVPPNKRECTDKLFIVFFLFCYGFLITSGFTARYSYDVFNPFTQTETNISQTLAPKQPLDSVMHSTDLLISDLRKQMPSPENKDEYSTVLVILAMSATALVLSILTVVSLRYCTGIMIYGSITSWCVFFLIVTFYSFATRAIFTGIMTLLMLLLVGFYLVSFRHQIPLSISFLQCGLIALLENLSLTLLVYPLLVIFGLFAFTVTIYSWTPIFTAGGAPVTLVLLAIFGVFMSFWTYEAFQSLATVTVSYSIGQWYVCRRSQNYQEPNSFVRAFVGLSVGLTYHLGTILLGSMIIAIVSTLRFLARWAQREVGGNDWLGTALRLIGCCAEWILGCLEGLLQYINRYAMIYTGLHGHSFREGCQKVWQLFLRADCQNFINDIVVGILVQMVTFLLIGLVFLSGLLTSVAIHGSTTSFVDVSPGPLVTLLILGIFLYTFGRLIIVTVDTLLVCYVEDLERNTGNGPSNCPDEWTRALEKYDDLPTRFRVNTYHHPL